MMGLYDMMDKAMAQELGVDIQTYIYVIEDVCTLDEADFIIDNIWQENGDIDASKDLFYKRLNKS